MFLCVCVWGACVCMCVGMYEHVLLHTYVHTHSSPPFSAVGAGSPSLPDDITDDVNIHSSQSAESRGGDSALGNLDPS